jgi:hypothetical protein
LIRKGSTTTASPRRPVRAIAWFGHGIIEMRVSSISSAIFAFSGAILLVVAFLSGGASILSFVERRQHGPGLFFADVQFFGFIALFCALTGGLAVFGAKKRSKRKQGNLS